MQKRIVPVFLIAALLICGMLSIFSIHQVQGFAKVINYAGVVRGATQRLVKEELYGAPNDGLVKQLDGLLGELRTGDGERGLPRLGGEEFQALLGQMQEEWGALKEQILTARAGKGRERLYELSESYFDLADRAVHAAEDYTAGKVRATEIGMLALILLLAGAGGTLMWFGSKQAKRREALEEEEAEYVRRKEYLDRMSESLRAPMNDISELLYICDTETYELLFLNETGKRTFGIGDDFSRYKCYEAVHGLHEPCPFCTNALLKPGEIYTWEHTNGVTQNHYLLKDRLVEWDGRTARMELAFDMSEVEQRKQELQRALDVEKMLIDCVRTLYQDAAFSTAISSMLEKLGGLLCADRAYIVLEQGGLLNREYEWHSQDAASQKSLPLSLPIGAVERWKTRFGREECMTIEDVEALREENPAEYELLSSRAVRSLVAAPLQRVGKVVGFLAVDNPPREYLEHVGPLFQALCYFIMLALERFRNEQELSRLSYYDTLTGFFNRNRYMHDIELLGMLQNPVGVLYLDVNGLKDINDQYGHLLGDSVLKQCADLVRGVFTGTGLYRIGGDEFVVLCPGMGKEEFETKTAELRVRFREDKICHAALGACWMESSGEIQKALIAADAEMYEDKKDFYRENRASHRYRHINDEEL